VAAGILGLESYSGFLFYIVGTTFVSLLIHVFLAGSKPGEYFNAGGGGGWGGWMEIWGGGGGVLGEGLSGFVLGWTGVGGLLRS
jgi:ER membrane protein complex subunit 6